MNEASPWNGIVEKLKQSDSHWHDTAEMLMRQRNLAEEERDEWKARAMKAEVDRQALRAEVIELREDRDSQKLRAETAERDRQTLLTKGTKFEQEWQALTTANTNLRDLLIIAEGQRDQAKIDAEHWKAEWALVMGQLGGARAEVEALRTVDDVLAEKVKRTLVRVTMERMAISSGKADMLYAIATADIMALFAERLAILTAPVAVQPTTGEGDE